MIKYVIKNDGSKQEFDAGKINAWGKWTAEQHNIKTGEWTEAVQRALMGKGEECTTKALQRSLINELIALSTWDAVMMAGTLEASVQAKSVFPKGMPSVREQFENMYMLGKMFKMPFTDEEWDQINAMVDHSRDFKLPQFAIKYIAESYAITDVASKSVLETPQFVYMRMACAVASSYPEGERTDVAFELYDLFSTQVLSAPTPNWTNLGTPENGLASCCLFTADDDRRSLAAADHISYVMTYSSAGLGYHHMVRSVGDPVRNGTIEHQGETGYLKSNAASAAANRQKKRGGAITAYISAHSREADEIIYGRHPMAPIDKAIRGTDIAVTINDDLLSRAIRKQKSLHFTKWSHPELYAAMYSPNHNKRFEAMMEEAIATAPEKDLFDARKTVVTMGTVAITSGRLYSFFADNANKHTPFLDKIYSSNLCVAPETKILTARGYKTIKDIAGLPVSVWNGEEFSVTEVVKTGENQKLLTVVTDSGYALDCTEYHKWYVCNDYGKPPVEVRTIDLKPGDKLIKFDLPVINGHKSLPQAYINGFYSGDGCLTSNGQRIYLYGEKRKLADQFEFGSIDNWTIQENYDRMYKHYDTLKEKFFVPGADYTVKSRLEWLAGYLDADGCVYRNGNNQQLTCASVEYDFLVELQLMLQELGIHSKIKHLADEGYRKMPLNDGTGELGDFLCKECWRLLIPSNQTEKLRSMGLPVKRLVLTEQTPQRDAQHFVQIKEVIDAGRHDDTYCFTEHKRHMGMFNGILTGQCNEVYEPTKPYKSTADLYRADDDVEGEVALCNLAAINHAKVADNPALHKRAAKAALRMIDYCVHHSHYELPHIGYTAKKRINAGVGVMNTAAYMAKNHLRYNSQEGLAHMHEFAERQSYFLIEASLELGQEKGNAPWIHKTKWAGYTDKDGKHVSAWMPIDTGNKKAAKQFGIETKMDWEDLRARVAANGGIRNSCLFAIMPGESSSKALGTANAIYPVRELSLNKTDSTTNIDWMAEGAGNASYEYQMAFELTTEETVWFYSVWQRWVDQGISADFWEDFSKKSTQIDADSILKKYKLMSNFGMKGHYYTVSKTQKSAEQMMKEDMEMKIAIGDINSADAVEVNGMDLRNGGALEYGLTAMDAPDFSAAVCGLDSKGGCTL